MKKNIRKYVLAAVFILGILIAAAFVLLRYRKEINNTEILRSYRVESTENSAQSEKLLYDLVRDELGQKMRGATAKSHLYLHLAATEEEITALGYDAGRVEERGFLLARRGNGLYVMARNDEDLSRGVRTLLKEYVDAEGNLLIRQDEEYLDRGMAFHKIAGPGGVSLAEYSIVCGDGVDETIANMLAFYVQDATGYSLPITTDASLSASLILEVDPSLSGHKIQYVGNDIVIEAQDSTELKRGIYVFANYALGYDFAGTDREKRNSVFAVTKLPEVYESEETPWISEREPIITLWNTNYSRGIFLNDSTSLKTDIMSYSDEQLINYVRMMKYCGFTGIQVTDMCSAWAGAGGYEIVHERLRLLADAAHSMDMKFTLWVWGAEFTGYGWADETVTYSYDGHEFAYENPAVISCFDKYYSVYAELADVCDRVIGHYYDPGNLSEAEDVAYFANMLREKFQKVNPQIDFGISCWVDKFDKSAFVERLGNNITLYESGHHDVEEDYTVFRTFCGSKQTRVGTWAWNTGEMEIDQLAQMNFQPHIISEVYNISRKYDEIYKPLYWSEMDSNHVVNIFSLYCEAKLLQQPDLNVDQLTEEVALAAVGPEYGARFADVLRLIEDARSGHSWDTFWWSSEKYILKSDDYPAKAIFDRSAEALNLLDDMIASDAEAYELPLPVSLCDLLRLMRPQVAQIHNFAAFRISLSTAEAMAQNEENREAVVTLLNHMSVPVSEYNTVTGLWGQIEARAQLEMLAAFCDKYNFERVVDPTFKQAQKNRIYSYFVSYQKGHQEPVIQYYPYFQYGVAYGEKDTEALVKELIEEGLFIRDEATGGVYVSDWEHYKYSFN